MIPPDPPLLIVTRTKGDRHGRWRYRHTDIVKTESLPAVVREWEPFGWVVEGVRPATLGAVAALMDYPRWPLTATKAVLPEAWPPQ